MRFAELALRTCALALVVAATGGCTTVQGMLPPTLGTPAAAAAPAASMPAAAVAPEPKAPPSETPLAVDPAAQRAFDAARQMLAAGRRDEAQRAFDALARSHPELGGPHANLGVIHLQAGRPAEAVAALELAVKASPRQPQFFDQLGIAHRHAGQFDKAREAYERALEIDPGFAPAHLNLGVLYDLYLWDSARALEHYDRYLALGAEGDDKVKRWVADLRKRVPQKPQPSLASRKEAQ